MTQSLVLKIKGLFTSVNELSEVPEGALLAADNIDILKDSIAEPRRGFDRLRDGANAPIGFATATDRAARTWFYQSKQFAHHGTPGSEGTVSYLGASAWTSLGSFTAPTGVRIRELLANQNLLFTTAAGVQKMDSYSATPQLAGAVKALDVQASTTGGSGFLAQNFRTAYRVVWGYKDANTNLVIGAPSQRESIKNAGGASCNVSLTIAIPTGVTTSWFFWVYRATQVDNTTLTTEPSDEMGLVYEGTPSSGDISGGSTTFTDIVVDALRGGTIYTAASQEGLAAQNERPPLAKDLASFRNVAFYANTVSKHRYYLTMIAVGTSAGVQTNDTVTIGGVAYTAKGTETITSAQFAVASGGSAAQNIRDTAVSLCRVINRYASSTVYAFYLSGPDDPPGKILLEERAIGGASFAITSSRATCWNPPTVPTSGTAESSTNDTYKNGLSWSKLNQPEAVPLGNFQQVGSKDYAILRVLPLKDALLILKEDGVYKLTGYYPNFNIELSDSSARLLAPESCAILNNQIFCLTDQGVTVISDGVKVISRPIEQDLLRLYGADLAAIKAKTFGVSYETDRKYYLFVISAAGETNPTQAFVYNVFTSTWVRHALKSSAGVVSDNRLYLADQASQYMLRDRKSYTSLDYADYLATTSITAASGTLVTLGTNVDLLNVGDVLYQSATAFATVLAINKVTSQVTVSTNPGFTVAAAELLKAIACSIKWVPITSANPGIQRQFHTAELLFKSDFNGTGYITFQTDLSQYDESIPVAGKGLGLWGLFPWGTKPWGGGALKRPVRQWVPKNKQRGSQHTVSFQHAYGFSSWQLQGVALVGTPGTERVAR